MLGSDGSHQGLIEQGGPVQGPHSVGERSGAGPGHTKSLSFWATVGPLHQRHPRKWGGCHTPGPASSRRCGSADLHPSVSVQASLTVAPEVRGPGAGHLYLGAANKAGVLLTEERGFGVCACKGRKQVSQVPLRWAAGGTPAGQEGAPPRAWRLSSGQRSLLSGWKVALSRGGSWPGLGFSPPALELVITDRQHPLGLLGSSVHPPRGDPLSSETPEWSPAGPQPRRKPLFSL